jgi:hypothetical protein
LDKKDQLQSAGISESRCPLHHDSISCQGIQLLLSAAELAELVNLLECADAELQSLHLISLFDQ